MFHVETVMEYAIYFFEIGAIAILVAGSLFAFWTGMVAWRRVGRRVGYEVIRHDVGRAILLGLEFLIIADIIKTVTMETTVQSALGLGLVVVVRTFLSFSLSIELDGHLPWRRKRDAMSPFAAPIRDAGRE